MTFCYGASPDPGNFPHFPLIRSPQLFHNRPHRPPLDSFRPRPLLDRRQDLLRQPIRRPNFALAHRNPPPYCVWPGVQRDAQPVCERTAYGPGELGVCVGAGDGEDAVKEVVGLGGAGDGGIGWWTGRWPAGGETVGLPLGAFGQ